MNCEILPLTRNEEFFSVMGAQVADIILIAEHQSWARFIASYVVSLVPF